MSDKLPLAKEYRILLDILLMAGEADRDFVRKELQKLDKRGVSPPSEVPQEEK